MSSEIDDTTLYIKARVYKKNKRVSNCPNTVFEVLRSSTILLYSCFDSNKSRTV